jgi:hypothetical protein
LQLTVNVSNYLRPANKTQYSYITNHHHLDDKKAVVTTLASSAIVL